MARGGHRGRGGPRNHPRGGGGRPSNNQQSDGRRSRQGTPNVGPHRGSHSRGGQRGGSHQRGTNPRNIERGLNSDRNGKTYNNSGGKPKFRNAKLTVDGWAKSDWIQKNGIVKGKGKLVEWLNTQAIDKNNKLPKDSKTQHNLVRISQVRVYQHFISNATIPILGFYPTYVHKSDNFSQHPDCVLEIEDMRAPSIVR